jgi:hypothetical protein
MSGQEFVTISKFEEANIRSGQPKRKKKENLSKSWH